MGQIQVTVSVDASGALDALDAVLHGDHGGHFEIIKMPDCCKLCRENEDPDDVPTHVNCRCEVVWVEDGD